MVHQVKHIIDGQPCFEKPLDEILSECEVGGGIKILSPLEYITDRQRAWYKGVCLPFLAKQSGDANATEWWDSEVKRRCNGLSLLKKEIFFMEDIMGNQIPIGRLTTKGVGKKNMRLFIEEILNQKDWEVPPPDPELRSF
jgi:hypothetical protein